VWMKQALLEWMPEWGEWWKALLDSSGSRVSVFFITLLNDIVVRSLCVHDLIVIRFHELELFTKTISLSKLCHILLLLISKFLLMLQI
jgi:hypothetical protein